MSSGVCAYGPSLTEILRTVCSNFGRALMPSVFRHSRGGRRSRGRGDHCRAGQWNRGNPAHPKGAASGIASRGQPSARCARAWCAAGAGPRLYFSARSNAQRVARAAARRAGRLRTGGGTRRPRGIGNVEEGAASVGAGVGLVPCPRGSSPGQGGFEYANRVFYSRGGGTQHALVAEHAAVGASLCVHNDALALLRVARCLCVGVACAIKVMRAPWVLACWP